MKNDILQKWLDKWDLIPSDGAKVLKISKSKVSEFLSDKSERTLPDYVAAHIETFDLLAPTKAKELIKKRLR